MIDREQFLRDGLYEYPNKSDDSFGWFQACETMFLHIRDLLPKGTVLELGSGWGSSQLAKHYKTYSVEHDKEFLGKHKDVDYIYASIDPKTGWYNVDELRKALPNDYDLIIVDGPPGAGIIQDEQMFTTRGGFNDNFNMFKQDVPMFWDDLHFHPVYNAFVDIALRLKKVPYIYVGDLTKSYGVIY